MSYFAKPNFIVYDEWFDDDFKKTKLDFKNKKIKTIANIHEFFYEQSNYKVGASENNLQIDIDKKKIIFFLIKNLNLFLVIFSKRRNFLFDNEEYFSEFFSK